MCPIFEFECPKCHEVSEILARTLECQIPLCPSCLTPTEKKLSTYHIRGKWRWYKESDYGRAGR